MAQYRGRPRGLNLADLYEVVAAAVPDRAALVSGDQQRSYAELDRRANRVANLLLSWGIRPGGRVATLLSNRVELVEVALGALKARAMPVVVGCGWPVDEACDLLRDAQAEVLAFEPCHSPVATAVAGHLASLQHLLVLDECRADRRAAVGAVKYEAALAGRAEIVPGIDRSPNDVYVLYERRPGGGPATAKPSRHEDLVVTCLRSGGRDVPTPSELPQRAADVDVPAVKTISIPLDDPAAQYEALATLLTGGTVVLQPPGRHDLTGHGTDEHPHTAGM